MEVRGLAIESIAVFLTIGKDQGLLFLIMKAPKLSENLLKIRSQSADDDIPCELLHI
jgi:hypothetical protein